MTTHHDNTINPVNNATGNTGVHDHAHNNGTVNGTPMNSNQAPIQRKPFDYGGNPLARLPTGDYSQAFGGEFQPGLYKTPVDRKFGNPAPLGLSAFALTTFVLSLINLGTQGVTHPNIVVGAAFAYGGLCQLLAGMWELAVGNTFGGTALSSYGGFWIGTAIILTPGGFEIETLSSTDFATAFGFYLMGWFIFTTILLIATLRSTLAFFLLFFTLDLAFLLLGIGYLTGVNTSCIKAGGVFGLLAAFLAWYNALAGILDESNSFFQLYVVHFPWSEKGRQRREKVDNLEAREKAI